MKELQKPDDAPTRISSDIFRGRGEPFKRRERVEERERKTEPFIRP